MTESNNIQPDYSELIQKTFDELMQCTDRLQKPESKQKVINAFEMAKKAHQNQYRKTGLKLPYIFHPLAVAKIVAEEMGLGSTTIAAALLHDVAEDSDFTVEDIEKQFGKEIALIVEGVTKIDTVKVPGRSKQVDTFRNFILKMSEDKRIAFVKIADRLHNLRTIDEMSENNKLVKTAESFEIYAPLAHQLGLFSIKKEIEDLSFKNRFPDEYKMIKQIVDFNYPEIKLKIDNILQPLNELLHKNNYDFKIQTLTKSYYKTWQIINEKKIQFDQIYNYLTIRIVINPKPQLSEKQQCYLVYSLLTDIFLVKENKLLDHITHPKTNGFQAIITNVMFGGNWYEVQIMTDTMHQIAQRGYAKNHDNVHLANISQWINSLGDVIDKKNISNEQFIQLITPQQSEIYVITPKGEIKVIKKGATVLDYAFNIHSELGLHFLAAEVDKKTVSFDYVLQNGEQVKIISSENSKPEKIWKKNLKIQRNRDILDSYFKKIRRNIIEDGRNIYESYIEKYKIKEEFAQKIINNLQNKNQSDFYFRLAKGRIKEDDILREVTRMQGFTRRIFDFFATAKKETETETKTANIDFDPKKTFIISNLTDISLALCCQPVEGDKAIVHKKNNNFIVHRSDCEKAKRLNASDAQNTSPAEWRLSDTNEFNVKIQITGLDRKALLADVINVISGQMGINMKKLTINSEKNIFIGDIELLINNLMSLNHLIEKIKRVKDVQKVYRVSAK